MTEEEDLSEAAKQAARFAERAEIDEKYKPALFLYALSRRVEPEAEDTTQSPPPTEPAASGGRVKTRDALRELFTSGFFSEGRSIDQVMGQLAALGYHFGYEATKKALQRSSFLRGEGNRSNRVFYQRYPPG